MKKILCFIVFALCSSLFAERGWHAYNDRFDLITNNEEFLGADIRVIFWEEDDGRETEMAVYTKVFEGHDVRVGVSEFGCTLMRGSREVGYIRREDQDHNGLYDTYLIDLEYFSPINTPFFYLGGDDPEADVLYVFHHDSYIKHIHD